MSGEASFFLDVFGTFFIKKKSTRAFGAYEPRQGMSDGIYKRCFYKLSMTLIESDGIDKRSFDYAQDDIHKESLDYFTQARAVLLGNRSLVAALCRDDAKFLVSSLYKLSRFDILLSSLNKLT